MDPVVDVVEVNAGRKMSRRSRTGRVSTVMIDRVWRVDVDGVPVGFVFYELVTGSLRAHAPSVEGGVSEQAVPEELAVGC